MKLMKMSIDIKVEKLLVSQFFYDLMVNGENVLVEKVEDGITYNGYPVEVDESVQDLKFVFDYSVEAKEGKDDPVGL